MGSFDIAAGGGPEPYRPEHLSKLAQHAIESGNSESVAPGETESVRLTSQSPEAIRRSSIHGAARTNYQAGTNTPQHAGSVLELAGAMTRTGELPPFPQEYTKESGDAWLQQALMKLNASPEQVTPEHLNSLLKKQLAASSPPSVVGASKNAVSPAMTTGLGTLDLGKLNKDLANIQQPQHGGLVQ